jgi:hypothetical protein
MGLSQQGFDVRPERLPLLEFGLGKLGQFRGGADAGQVAVIFPVGQSRGSRLFHGGFDVDGNTFPSRKVGSEPIERLAA